MEYGVLGPLRVIRDGHEVSLRGQRVRDLLAVLLTRRGQTVDPGVLLDLVWRDQAATLEVAVVHTVVARLRRTLGSDAIETTDSGYRLAHAPTDAEEFAELVARGRAGSGERAVADLRQALALWRAAPAYADVSDEVVAADRPRLHELRLTATESLAEALLATADSSTVGSALALGEQLIDEEPLREKAYELVMLAAYRSGRRADALAAYQRLRRALRQELGIDPGQSATRLHAAVLAQDPSLAVTGTPPRSTRPDPRRPAPAAPSAPIIGREDELGVLLVAIATRRLVSLVGPGGVGKTRLLTEAWLRVSADRDAGYVDMTSLGVVDTAELAEAFGRGLQVALPADDPLGGLGEALALRDLVVFVDEAERASEAAAEVIGTLVRACPQLVVVVSSRRALDLVGERRIVLAPLPCPAPEAAPAEARAAPAVRLLQERLLDLAPDVRLTDADLVRLGEVARRVDGLPLALELVARYAAAHGVPSLDHVIEAPLALTGSEPDRPERHRSLRETILWSADRLAGPQRATLRRLGMFVGPFDATAAAAVVGPAVADVGAACRALAREALIQVHRGADGEIGWRLLRTVRDLAIEGLVEEGELLAARARHRHWLASRWRGALRSDRLLYDVRDHYGDYLEALRTALADRDSSTLADLVLTLGRLWIFTDQLGPGLRWTQLAIDSGLLSSGERARVRVFRATLELHYDPDAVRTEIELALPALVAEKDFAWQVSAYVCQAVERFESGLRDEALAAARAAVAAAQPTTPERQADALGVAAFIEATEDADAARASIRLAWELARNSRSLASMASVASNLALAHIQLGDARAALALLDEIADQLGEDAVPVFLVVNAAWAALGSDEPARALLGFASVVAASRDAPADRRAAEVYVGAGCALAALGHPAAADLLTGADDLRRRVSLDLMPWMAAQRDAAHARLGLPETTTAAEPTLVVGQRLADVVLECAAMLRFDADL